MLSLLGACGGGESAASAGSPMATALRVALAEHGGDRPIDHAVRTAQSEVREAPQDVARLERLATLFVAKARASGDPGYYKQAEACAETLLQVAGGDSAAKLVLGHVRHALHDFGAAERIARELVAARGMFLDHGLLGDVLLDEGRLDEARAAYQRMLDLKPCLQSYARAAQVRWLGGDLDGCRELLELAAHSGSQRDPESLAWVLTRRATLELEADDAGGAMAFAAQALQLMPDYPAALVVRGRAELARGDAPAAASSLSAAVAQSPLPGNLWVHAEALRAAGRADEAVGVERDLDRIGEQEDPRTLALWLASSGREPQRALRVAMAEFGRRQDCYTLDALALARLGAGDVGGADTAIRSALACGVRDARISLHAVAIALAVGDRRMATEQFEIADARRAALLPDEQRRLTELAQRM